MKRYPSIDFLRGLAIFMMVFVHTFMRWFDQGTFLEKVNAGLAPLFFIVLMVVLLFIGSWAGFFLMVSAMGNMMSMSAGLEKGQTAGNLILKQVIGGIILLIFAYLAEGVIGYKGALGEWIIGSQNAWYLVYYRGYHMETIHAVAWAIILNGIVQGILSINGGHKKIKRNIKIYAILAVIVIAVTQFVWFGFDSLVPDGNYSHGSDPITGMEWKYGNLLLLDPWTNFVRIFLQPWAGAVEPMFPFLGVSFIGSIIGLIIIDAKNHPDHEKVHILKQGMGIAAIITFTSLILFAIGALMTLSDPFDILGIISTGYDVTGIENKYTWLWLPYFLMVTGVQLGLILYIFRIVEYRGKAESTAKKSLFFRRFGFVAFSVYTFQFIDIIPVYLLTLIPGFPAYHYGLFDEFQIWFALILIILEWAIVLKLWEKVSYVFGMEWFIAKISELVLPMKRKKLQEGEKKLPWWKTPRLDVQAALHDAEWLEIIPAEKLDHEHKVESRLAFKVALTGFIFFAASFIAVGMAKTAEKSEGLNENVIKARRIAWINIVIFFIVVIMLFILTTALLG